MKKLRDWLIHLLGGYTHEEYLAQVVAADAVEVKSTRLRTVRESFAEQEEK